MVRERREADAHVFLILGGTRSAVGSEAVHQGRGVVETTENGRWFPFASLEQSEPCAQQHGHTALTSQGFNGRATPA